MEGIKIKISKGYRLFLAKNNLNSKSDKTGTQDEVFLTS